MSALTKERLKEAVHDVTVLADDIHPTNALAKVAASLNLTDYQTQLVGRAYNTAAYHDKRAAGQSLLEKFASFALADADEAIALRRQKTAEVKTKAECASVYDRDLDVSSLKGSYAKKAMAAILPVREKQAAAPVRQERMDTLLSDDAYLKRQEESLTARSYRLHKDIEKHAFELRLSADRLTDGERLAIKLAVAQRLGPQYVPCLDSTVKTAGTFSAAPVNESVYAVAAELLKTAEEFAETVAMLDKVAKCRKEIRKKRSQKTQKHAAAPPFPITHSQSGTTVEDINKDIRNLLPDDLAQKQHDRNIETEDRTNREQDTQQARKWQTDDRTEVQKIRDQQRAEDRANRTYDNRVEFAKDEINGMLGSMVTGPTLAMDFFDRITGNSSSQSKTPPLDTSSVIPSRFLNYGIMTPSHAKKLETIKMRSQLNDFMSNDDIISQYEPQAVVAAYNELLEMAPDMMRRPSMARVYLREMLAKGNAISTFDMNNALSAESTLNDIKAQRNKQHDSKGT